MATDVARVAFISGHTDLSQIDFDRIYEPLICEAIASGHTFILGDALGVDTIALTYLLSWKDDLRQRVTVYASRKYNIPKLTALGVKVIGPDDSCLAPTPEIETLIGIENEGRNKARFRHLIRDTHMTLNSNYDILYVRSEEGSRELYGEKYKPRVSATEHNRLRRVKVGSGRPVAQNHPQGGSEHS